MKTRIFIDKNGLQPPQGKPRQLLNLQHQRGLSLVELLVGIAIGLLVVAVGVAALVVSRTVSGSVTDASSIAQQGAYAMRVIGSQLRMSGALYLNLNPSNPGAPTTYSGDPFLTPVAFETQATGTTNSFDKANYAALLSGSSQNLTGTTTSTPTTATLTVGFRNHDDPVYTGTANDRLIRNCAGGPAFPDSQLAQSVFRLNPNDASNTAPIGTALQCGDGSSATTFQPVVNHVANFQVFYLFQDAVTSGKPTIQRKAAADVDSTKWNQVQAVEVCLVLYGDETVDMPAGDGLLTNSYVDCPDPANLDSDPPRVNMTTLTGPRKNRMHMRFDNVFQLRSRSID